MCDGREGGRGRDVVMGAGSRAVSSEDTELFRGKGMKVQSNRSQISEMQQLGACFLGVVALSAGQGQLLSHQVSYTSI